MNMCPSSSRLQYDSDYIIWKAKVGYAKIVLSTGAQKYHFHNILLQGETNS